ncbi:MAG: agmatinase [Candidatus Parvarchaeota archaeon]
MKKMSGALKFAGSSGDYSLSRFVIYGAPFDSTTSFRSGQRFAPNRIREASSTLERFVFEWQFNLKEMGLFDRGDLESTVSPEVMKNEVSRTFKELFNDGKYPIMLGGEHSVSIGISENLEDENVSVLFLDAHPDFRDSLLGERLSHGSVARRTVDVLGIERVGAIGLRAISKEEYQDPLFSKYNFFTTDEVRRYGTKAIVDKVLTKLKFKNIYLSLDLDVMDPAYAPGVATPEPFGLDPFQIKEIINLLGKRLIGADIVELSPPYDNGNTAVLAARFVQEIISSSSTSQFE